MSEETRRVRGGVSERLERGDDRADENLDQRPLFLPRAIRLPRPRHFRQIGSRVLRGCITGDRKDEMATMLTIRIKPVGEAMETFNKTSGQGAAGVVAGDRPQDRDLKAEVALK